jgi:hypothetical protein
MSGTLTSQIPAELSVFLYYNILILYYMTLCHTMLFFSDTYYKVTVCLAHKLWGDFLTDFPDKLSTWPLLPFPSSSFYSPWLSIFLKVVLETFSSTIQTCPIKIKVLSFGLIQCLINLFNHGLCLESLLQRIDV